jgi:hypothetical protein
MLRENPAVGRRDFAAKMMLDLAEKFGFTPLDRAKLIHAQCNAARRRDLVRPGASRAGRAGQANAATPDAVPAPSSAGSARSFDSRPPGRPN